MRQWQCVHNLISMQKGVGESSQALVMRVRDTIKHYYSRKGNWHNCQWSCSPSSSTAEAAIGQSYLVAVVVRFEGTVAGQTQIFGLLLCQFSQFDAQLVQVRGSHLLVQLHMHKRHNEEHIYISYILIIIC